jgi:hypothetical protein
MMTDNRLNYTADNQSHPTDLHPSAIDQMLNLPARASKQEVLAAIEGYVLDKAELMGRYAREIE